MRKGDERRGQILEAAETLFSTRGYEQTSVQDILDALGLSKGGFYHHFDSKLALLEAICSRRAEESLEAGETAVARAEGDPVSQLNGLLSAGGLWHADRVSYIDLLLRVAYREDGALMREKLKMRTFALMRPCMDRVIVAGVRRGVFALPRADLAGELVLRMAAILTDDIAFQLAGPGSEQEHLSAILSRLELYRHAVERTLGAPFGSIVLYEMEPLSEVCRRLHAARSA